MSGNNPGAMNESPSNARAAGIPAWLGFLVFVLAFLSYAWSAPRGVVLEDDGFFNVAAFFNLPAHPPGYPLYAMLAHLATWLPAGSVAFRVHLFTAATAALACVLLGRIAARCLGSRLWAALAALALAFAPTFWSQGIIAEVYALNVLLLLALIDLALQRTPDGAAGAGRWALATGMGYGLALSNHWPLVALATPALAAFFWPHRRALLRRAPVIGAGVLLGLVPYAWMVHRTHVLPELCFFGPISSWTDFWYVLSREGYRGGDYSPSAGLGDKVQYAAFALAETGRQFVPFAWPFAAMGFVRQWRQWPRHWCWGWTLAFLGSTFLLVALRNSDYELIYRNSFRVYPLVAYAAVAVWLALGAQLFAAWLAARLRTPARARYAGPALAALLLATAWMQGAAANYRARDDWAERYAAALLDSLPPGAALYANADTVNGPVGYRMHVEGARPDVALYSDMYLPVEGTAYRLYLVNPRARRELIGKFVRSGSTPVFHASDFQTGLPGRDHGLYFEVIRPGAESSASLVNGDRIYRYLDGISRLPPPADPWEWMHYWWLRADHCRAWAKPRAPELADLVRRGDFRPCDHYEGRLFLVGALLRTGERDFGLMEKLLEEARALREQAPTKRDSSRLDLLLGEVLIRAGKGAEAQAHFRSAVDRWPHPDNPARAQLASADVP
jgi:hypothetical protein